MPCRTGCPDPALQDLARIYFQTYTQGFTWCLRSTMYAAESKTCLCKEWLFLYLHFINILWKQTVCQLQKYSLRRESGSKACTEQPGKDCSIGSWALMPKCSNYRILSHATMVANGYFLHMSLLDCQHSHLFWIRTNTQKHKNNRLLNSARSQ